jgi:hypothetical protein
VCPVSIAPFEDNMRTRPTYLVRDPRFQDRPCRGQVWCVCALARDIRALVKIAEALHTPPFFFVIFFLHSLRRSFRAVIIGPIPWGCFGSSDASSGTSTAALSHQPSIPPSTLFPENRGIRDKQSSTCDKTGRGTVHFRVRRPCVSGHESSS